MGYSPEEEVCITTVVVKGPGASLRAAQQHELVARALSAESAGMWAPAARAPVTRATAARAPGVPGGAPAMQPRPLSRRGPFAHGPRLRGDRWRFLYLAASVLFLASAIVFGYLAFK